MMRGRARAAVVTLTLTALCQVSSEAQFGFQPRGGFGTEPEQKIVKQYDKDGDGRLSREERKAARSAVGGSQSVRPFRGTGASGSAGRRVAPADVRPYPSTPLYDLGTLRTIFLQFEDADWERELADFHNTDVE